MQTKFEEAVNMYREATCITFIEALEGYTGEITPIIIKGTGTGCHSTVGGPGGNLNLQERICDHLGVALHEIGHALGVYHEHNRIDRDDYVSINLENVMAGYANNFNKVDYQILTRYDHQSVMHYAPFAFSMDGTHETITPVALEKINSMGKQQMLSRLDKYKLNQMYSCYGNCPSDLASQCLHGGVPSKYCTCICPDEYIGPYCDVFNKQTDCSGEYAGPSGVITSPNFSNRYPSNSLCVYAIECQAVEKVKLTFTEFDLEGYGCFFDTLEMKIGNIVDEIYPDKYCDTALRGKALLSKTNLALLKFHSDSMFNYPGFKLEYQCE